MYRVIESDVQDDYRSMVEGVKQGKRYDGYELERILWAFWASDSWLRFK